MTGDSKREIPELVICEHVLSAWYLQSGEVIRILTEYRTVSYRSQLSPSACICDCNASIIRLYMIPTCLSIVRVGHLHGLAVLGQLLFRALLTAGPDGPGELVCLGGVFVRRQDLGVLSTLELMASTHGPSFGVEGAYRVDKVVHLGLVRVVTCLSCQLSASRDRASR